MAGALTRVRAAVARTPCPDENLVMRTNRRPLNRRRGPEQREGRHAQAGGEMQRAGVAGNEDLRALQYSEKCREVGDRGQEGRVRRELPEFVRQ